MDNMAFYTNRYNIKPMFGFVAFVMMILLCLYGTIMANQEFGRNQFANHNGITHSTSSFDSFGMVGTKTNFTFPTCYFAFFCLVVSFSRNLTFYCFFITKFTSAMCCFALFCLVIFLIAFRLADFAITLIAVFLAAVFVEFRQWLGFFAFGTSFRYDGFRHNRFLYKRFCLEPIAGTYQRSACFSLIQ